MNINLGTIAAKGAEALSQVNMAEVGSKVTSAISAASNIVGRKTLNIKSSFLEQHKAGPNELTSKILSSVMDAFQTGRRAKNIEHSDSGGSFQMDGAAHGADRVNYERDAADPSVMSFLGVSDKAGKLLLSLGKSVVETFANVAAKPTQDPAAVRQDRYASVASKSSLSQAFFQFATQGMQQPKAQQRAATPTPPPMPQRPNMGSQQADTAPPLPPRPGEQSGAGRPRASSAPPRSESKSFPNQPWADNPQSSASSGRPRASSAPPPGEPKPFANEPWAETEKPRMPPRPNAGQQRTDAPPPPPRPGAQPNTGRPRASSAPPPRPPKEPFGSSGPSTERPGAKPAGSAKMETETPAAEAKKTPYEVLGVLPSASAQDIKKVFRRAALANHPDHAIDKEAATKTMQALNAAYDILKDEDLRKKYDMANPL